MFQIFTILLDLRVLDLKTTNALSLVSKSGNYSIKLTNSKKHMYALSLNSLFRAIGISSYDFDNMDRETYNFYITVLADFMFDLKSDRVHITPSTHMKLDKLYPARRISSMSLIEILKLQRQINKSAYLSSILNIALKPKKSFC